MMEESHMHKKLAVTEPVDVIAGNDDILSEILLRLPARSLVRLSVVCKHWRSLITSNQFRLSHCHILASSSVPTPSGIYFYDSLTESPEIESLPLTDDVTSLPSLPLLDLSAATEVMQVEAEEVKVTQSCNGLLMCVITCRSDRTKRAIVYNPATKEYRLLPSPNCYFVYYYMISDPLEPPYYKAFCIKRLDGYSGDVDVSVYVPGSDSWVSCCRFTPPDGMCFDQGVIWNGAIHWVDDYFSLYFDATTKEIIRKKMPPCLQKRNSCENIRYFGEWGGHLHLIHIQSVRAKKFNVLELDKDTWEWSVKYRVHLPWLISAYPEMDQYGVGVGPYAFSILSVIRGEKEEDSVLLLTIPGKMVAYNLASKTFKVVRELHGWIGDDDIRTLLLKYVSAYKYAESLAPV